MFGDTYTSTLAARTPSVQREEADRQVVVWA